MKTEAEQHGSRHLYEKLLRSTRGGIRIHENDTKRIIRAIEVILHTRKTISEHIRTSRIEPPYKYIVFGLKWDEILYRRINERVDKMIRKDWWMRPGAWLRWVLTGELRCRPSDIRKYCPF